MLPLIVQVEKVSEHSAQTIAFDYSPVRIGRNPLNDINLGDAFVSAWHAVIRFDNGGTFYVDLGSRNGSTVDGRRLRKNEEVRIEPNTDLRIGPLRLHLLRGEAPSELLNVPRATAFVLGGALAGPAADRTAYVSQAGAEQLVGLRNARAGGQPSPPSSPSPSPRGGSDFPPAPVPGLVFTPPGAGVAPQGGSSIPPRMAPAQVAPQLAAMPSPAAPLTPQSGSRMLDVPTSVMGTVRQPPTTMDALYAEYRAAWTRLRDQMQRELATAAPDSRTATLDGFRARFPGMFHEPEIAPPAATGPTPAAVATGTVGEDTDIKAWLSRLTNGLYPPPMVKPNTAMTMERLGAILEVFSQAFVELRRGQHEFCHEMALEQMHDNTTLYKTEDPRVVLAYLLDPTSAGATRVKELSRAFADFALHQVALVSGVTEGARAVLEQLAPDELGRGAAREGDGALLSRMFGGDTTRLWKRFQTQYENLMEGERFTRELFGRPFASAYFRMTGGRISHVPDL